MQKPSRAVVIGACISAFFLIVSTLACNDRDGLDVISDGTPPAQPTSLSVSAASSTSMAVAWIDESDNETGFRIERALGDTSDFEQLATVTKDTTSYLDTGLMPVTDYTYRVRAYNAAGPSPYTAAVQATTAAIPLPVAPTGLTAAPQSTTSIQLQWTDASSNETGFQVERAPGGTSSFANIASLGANTTFYLDSGLSPSTAYAYRVRAINGSGPSAYAGPVQATTEALPNSAPSANAGPDQGPLDPEGSVSLSGSGSDPDGGALSYQWTQVGGPTVTISNANSANASFISPSRTTATYTFRLQVTDSGSPALSAFDNVSISTRVTYNNAVASIINSRCATCHAPAPQGIGQTPYLRNFSEVYAVRLSIGGSSARGIRTKITTGTMQNKLTSTERQVVVGWIDNGAPESN